MHPIHPILVHYPIALLTASVIFDLLGMRWRPESCRIHMKFRRGYRH